MNLQSTHCCGLKIYEGVVYDNLPQATLCHIARDAAAAGINISKETGRPSMLAAAALILFADVRGLGVTSHMEGIIRIIVDNCLGTIWSSDWSKNVINDVRTVTWCVDKEAFAEWAIRTIPEISERVFSADEWMED